MRQRTQRQHEQTRQTHANRKSVNGNDAIECFKTARRTNLDDRLQERSETKMPKMPYTIKIELNPEAIALVQRFKSMPDELPQAIKRGMNKSLETVAGRIREKRLSGKGPFPVSEHRLGERTGLLKSTTQGGSAIVISEGDNATISGTIGSDAFYAKFHEFGSSRAPERAPFRTGIEENRDYIRETITEEIRVTLK